MKLAIAALAGVVLFNVTDAEARQDNWPNWYVGVHGEMEFVSDADTSVNSAGVGDVEFDAGYGVGLTLGYRPYYSNSGWDNFRFEGEFFYRTNDFDSLNASTGNTPLNGDLEGTSLMFNTYYDVETGSSITPYIGAGLGMTQWDFSDDVIGVADSDTVFSYQAMAGLYFSPESMPRTDWGVGYRYFGTAEPEFTTNTGATLEHDYNSHNVEFFGRFHF